MVSFPEHVIKILSGKFLLWPNGILVSLELWDTGAMPDFYRYHNFGSDLIPGPGTPYAAGQPEKNRKKKISVRPEMKAKILLLTLFCLQMFIFVLMPSFPLRKLIF